MLKNTDLECRNIFIDDGLFAWLLRHAYNELTACHDLVFALK